MPHLWMFLLKALTPPEHEVLLIDGNAQPMTDTELVRFVLRVIKESFTNWDGTATGGRGLKLQAGLTGRERDAV